MNIAFFTENNFKGKVPRSQGNRTDTSWMVGLDAQHFPLSQENFLNFDLGIIIVPKKNPFQAFYFFEKHRKICKKWAVMQESDQIGWQRYSITDQINYLNLLNEVDLILCHNEIDEVYFKGLIPHKNVSVLPSLMIEDAIPSKAKKVPQNRTSCIIGGTWTDWYSGQDSFLIAQEFGESIYAPSMGRKQIEEDQIEGLKYLPYMNWAEWMVTLNQFKYGVHLMRTYAAGTFSLNAARLKLPTIGWGNGCDTQRLLFPELSPPEGDMVQARKLAKHLKENQLFYDHCAEYAFKKYSEIYSEEIFISKFNQIINQLK